MNKLPSDTIRLLSCSQVVTSVSSAVKELVENALDAQATSIDVKLEKWGLNKIEVRDNGCGIKESDTVYMAQKSCTSKITKHEDLCQLSTYGFRGEALGSLCQISDVSITTKTADDAVAMCYCVDSTGKITSKKPIHDGNGTTVTSSRLFKNLPVRKQFYNTTKKCKEELKKIEDMLMAYGLMNPNVRISLKNDKTLVWQKNSSSDFRSAILDVFGVRVCNQLEYLEYNDNKVNVAFKCFLPKISSDCQLMTRATDDRCFIFINKRYVVWRELAQLLKKMCILKNEQSSSGRFPLCFLSLELPAGDVDANLEPNKTKVLIKQKEDVLAILAQELGKFYENQDVSRPCAEVNHASSITSSGYSSDDRPTETTSKMCQSSSNMIPCSHGNALIDDQDPGQNLGIATPHLRESHSAEQLLPRTECESGGNRVSPQNDLGLNQDNLQLQTNYRKDAVEEDLQNCSIEQEVKCAEHGDKVVGVTNNGARQSVLGTHPVSAVPKRNSCSSNENVQATTPLVSTQQSQSEFDDLVENFMGDLSDLDDSCSFTIDPPLTNQEEWSKGHGLCDKNGASVEPVNLLVPITALQSATGNDKSRTPVLNGKRKHSSLSDKDPSPKSCTGSKKAKKVSQISGQSLLTSVLQSPKTNKLAKKMKRSTVKEVKFSLSSLKLARNSSRQERPSLDDIQLIKRLDPWGVWLTSQNRQLFVLNPFRVQELLLYKRLLVTHIIPREKLGQAIVLNERILGSDSRYSMLEKLVQGTGEGSSTTVEYCSDKRLVANGFEICGKPDHENGKYQIEIVKMNTTIPYFGVRDLIEILDMMNNERSSGVSDEANTLACCRPSKVCNFLKDEVVRVVRGLASRTTEADMSSILTKMKTELKEEEKTCVHGLPFLYPLLSY